MANILTFEQVRPDHLQIVGGKGLSLGRLAQAGLPVPPGFCIVSQAQQQLQGRPPAEDPGLRQEICSAYQQLGNGIVAVRSSATDEDGTVSSFAGQQETILGVQGDEALLDAIHQCWESLTTERARAYRQHQGMTNGMAMSVVVQQMVPADVAGVLFTVDPFDPEGRHMLVEASWGLGETVVSGQVMPDRFQIDRETGEVTQSHIQIKTVQRLANGIQPVPPQQQKIACLENAQLAQLADLGKQVEAIYGEPRDIEWAWVGSPDSGQLYLLQARPITTSDAARREQVRLKEIAKLRAEAAPNGTVWSRYNLYEILPEPTPMTWAIVCRLMSGRGGMGLMYRDLGYKPSPQLDECGTYDLVCGRPYCNLSREPLFYSGWLPYEHPFDRLKANPQKALYPQPIQNPSRAGAWFWLFLPFRLPFLIFGSLRFVLRLTHFSQSFADHFRTGIIPPYLEEVAREEQEDPSGLTVSELLERLEYWIHRCLYDFARDSLKPTVLANVAIGNLTRLLQRRLTPGRAQEILGELSMGARPDVGSNLPAALEQLQHGEMSEEAFLEQFGHRGPEEMELSQPRWKEKPGSWKLPGPPGKKATMASEPLADLQPKIDAVAEEAQLTGWHKTALEQQVQAMQTYLGLRETGKHHLMRGYTLIRRFLVELDQRWNLQGDIFFLTPTELPRLSAGEDLSELIEERKQQRQIALSLEVPAVLFSDQLNAIGQPVAIEGAEVLQGTPLSSGSTEGPVLVLRKPQTDAIPDEPYILVCPSTDPAWVPLFLRAKGLIMETGGALSHGAIVAREFGLPAVAGIPGILDQLKTGQKAHIDGATGKVSLL